MKGFTSFDQFFILWRIWSEAFVLLKKDIQFVIFVTEWDISRCQNVKILPKNESYDLE